MKLQGNTILITGGGSGIGLALAQKFLGNGNKVIITGRNQPKLDAAVTDNPSLEATILDVSDAEAITAFAAHIKTSHPDLNVVVHNAGIMETEIIGETSVESAERQVVTNLLGPIRLTAALLPIISANADAAIMTVSSGLAFLPLSLNPTYCATKAAIHSYTQSLRYQLRDKGVQVVELIPPYVQTGLTGERQAHDPMAMPLDEFIAEAWNILETNPYIDEIVVERAKMQRTAEVSGEYDTRYQNYNDTLVKVRS